MNGRLCLLVSVLVFGIVIQPSRPRAAQGQDLVRLRVRAIDDLNAAQAFLPFLTETLTAELHFVKKVCNPNVDQFRDIHRAGLESITEIGITYSDMKRRRVKVETWPDPSEAITAALQEDIDRLLPPSASKTYRAEVAARNDARAAANAALMVTLIDQLAVLDPNQQDEIFRQIRANWSLQWSKRNVMLRFPQYAVLPDADVLRPYLSDLQQRLWSYRPKRRNVTLSWNLNFGDSNFFGVEGLEEFVDPNLNVDAEESE